MPGSPRLPERAGRIAARARGQKATGRCHRRARFGMIGRMDEQPPAGPSPATETETDAELVEQARGGETAAFETLFERYRDRVYRVVYGYVGNREDALDVTQEAFLKAYQKLAGFKGEARFSTWVTQIAIHRAIDVRRRRKRRKASSLEEQHDRDDLARLPGRGSPRRGPGARLEEAEFEQKLREALEQLSDKHRTVFLLHTQQGLAYKEIAATLGISIGTVMSRLFYARKKLQKALEDYLGPAARARAAMRTRRRQPKPGEGE
ncbi:MAG: sigma-70 family RNA polymerase sigma factor [Planctomycetota bacterium]|nr:MAG: sigma-70 family RNA polymerase sigma factor [Planctomycetota bacterium]